jgi:hypothetical protein
MIGRVWSPLIGASGHSALSVPNLTVAIDRTRPVSTYFAELAGNGWN